jgi:hypothetical protein
MQLAVAPAVDEQHLGGQVGPLPAAEALDGVHQEVGAPVLFKDVLRRRVLDGSQIDPS